MVIFSSSPRALIRSIVKHRALISGLIRRDIVGRYQGSLLGLLWSFLNPFLMLLIYTFVFRLVLKARWGGNGGESDGEFAIVLFIGLILFNLFAESVTRAPTLVTSCPNYVKKVVFPLEVLPLVPLGSALFHAAASFLVWLIAKVLSSGLPPVTACLLPLILAPLILLTLGLGYFFSALGVYLRDLGQVVGLFTTALMFLSPVFYPMESIPERFRPLIRLNPISSVVETAREVLIYGILPDVTGWAISLCLSFAVLWFGLAWFQKTRKGFADVL